MVQETEIAVLFVCMGNICRSPTAEGAAARMLAEHGLAERVRIDSAGTHGYHVGAAPDARSQAAAADRGLDLSALRARRVTADDFEEFDLIVAMDEANYRDLLALKSSCDGRAAVRRLLDFAEGGEVPDPYFGSGDGFQRVLDAVEAGCRGLIAALEAGEIRRP